MNNWKVPKSNFGLILLIIYLMVLAVAWFKSMSCSASMFCDFIVLLPVMPWLFWMEGILADSWLTYVSLVFLNALLVYSLGYLLEIIYKKFISKFKNNGEKK